MNQSVDFKTANYFTGMPYVLGFVLTPIGIFLLFSPQIIIGAILLIAGIIILSTHYRLAIDHTKKQYTEYVFILGLKAGIERKAFSSIEYVFIKKSKVSQTLNSRASSTTIQKIQYDGFLKFSEDNKVHLMTVENKGAILKKLKVIASRLNLKILDYSDETPVNPA